MFVYLCIGRFGNDWNKLNEYFNNKNNDNIYVSKGLFLDLCPFIGFLLPLSIIFDPTRKFASIVSPFGLFGGLITIFALDSNESPIWSAKYIFLGTDMNEMYFMMHFLMVIVSVFVLVSTPRFKMFKFLKVPDLFKKINCVGWFYSLCFISIYYLYVGILMNVLNVTDHVSGLNLNDWDPNIGEYGGVATTLNLNATGAAALGFIASIITISLIIFGFSYLQEIKKYYWSNEHNNKHWYLSWYKLVNETKN